MKKFFGRLLAIIVAIIVVAGVTLWTVTGPLADRFSIIKHSTPTIESSTIKNSFDDAAELATEEYHFSRVGKRDDQGMSVFGKNVPLTGKHFLITYSGVARAGVKNYDTMTVDIKDSKKEIDVTLPKVQVLSTEIEPSSIEVYDQTMNPFNQFKVEDLSTFLTEEEKSTEEEAIQGGLLTRAEQRAKDLATNQVKALTKETDKDGYTVTVTFK